MEKAQGGKPLSNKKDILPEEESLLLVNSAVSFPDPTLAEKEKEIANSFVWTKQNKGINAINYLTQNSKNTDIDPFTKNITIKNNKIIMLLPNEAYQTVKTKQGFEEKPLQFNTFTQKLFNVIMSQFNKTNNNPQIVINIEDFKKLCSKQNDKELRKNIKNSLWLLREADFSLTGNPTKNPQDDFHSVHILGNYGISKGNIVCSLTIEMAQYSSNAAIMPLPKALFKLNERKNPNSFHFYFKILNHYQMNILKPNANRIAIKTLLEGSYIPTFEEVKNGNRNYTDRITTPFIRDLEALELEETYYNKRKVPLTDEQLKKLSYFDLIDCIVEFTLPNYPNEIVKMAKEKATQKRKKIEKKK